MLCGESGQTYRPRDTGQWPSSFCISHIHLLAGVLSPRRSTSNDGLACGRRKILYDTFFEVSRCRCHIVCLFSFLSKFSCCHFLSGWRFYQYFCSSVFYREILLGLWERFTVIRRHQPLIIHCRVNHCTSSIHRICFSGQGNCFKIIYLLAVI